MITSLYAALLAALFLWLSIQVILYRRKNRISLGDSGDKGMLKRMRAQANCAEYAPFALVLMTLAELQGASAAILHLIGALLAVGRFMHGYGFSARPPIMALRVYGMILTLISMMVSIVVLLALFFFGA